MQTLEGVKVSTTHEEFGEIEVHIDVNVPETVEEADEFYGSRDKTISALQSDVRTRVMNAVRPVLASATSELDWQSVAQATANDYKPGRRGGPSISVSETEGLDADELRELLLARGVLKG